MRARGGRREVCAAPHFTSKGTHHQQPSSDVGALTSCWPLSRPAWACSIFSEAVTCVLLFQGGQARKMRYASAAGQRSVGHINPKHFRGLLPSPPVVRSFCSASGERCACSVHTLGYERRHFSIHHLDRSVCNAGLTTTFSCSNNHPSDFANIQGPERTHRLRRFGSKRWCSVHAGSTGAAQLTGHTCWRRRRRRTVGVGVGFFRARTGRSV